MTKQKDTIYRNFDGEIKPFEFDERVADVFPDMINRSVPGYFQSVALLGVIAKQYSVANSQIYDLGCSLGACTLSMSQALNDERFKIIAVDISEPMITRCKKQLQRISNKTLIEIVHADVRDIEIHNASIVVMNYTLQFLPLPEREKLIQKIYSGLNEKGVLAISEKIIFEDEEQQNRMTELHHRYKKLNGYDDMEISGKRTALENILIPETINSHKQRCESVGFQSFDVLMQNFNFITFLAQK